MPRVAPPVRAIDPHLAARRPVRVYQPPPERVEVDADTAFVEGALSVQQACQFAAVSRNTLLALVRSGAIVSRNQRRKRRICKRSLRQWLMSGKQ